MSLSQLVGIIALPFRRWPRRHAPKRQAKVMPRLRARVFEVQPQRIGNTDFFVYRVVNLRTGEIVKRTAILALAEAMCEQCNCDYEALQTVIRTAANHQGIAEFNSVQATKSRLEFVKGL